MPKAPFAPNREKLRAIVPDLVDYTHDLVYGQIWERPGLSKRDRSLVTVAALIALARPDFVKTHIERAIGNGVTREEISEVITHLPFYAGWPAAMSAGLMALKAIDGDAAQA